MRRWGVQLSEPADRYTEPDDLGSGCPAARAASRQAAGWRPPSGSPAGVHGPSQPARMTLHPSPDRGRAPVVSAAAGGSNTDQVEHLRLPPPPPSRLWSVPGAGEGALQLLHDSVGAVEGVLVHAAEGVDQLAVGAVALGVAGQLVLGGRVVDALERLLDFGDLERHRSSLVGLGRTVRDYHADTRANRATAVNQPDD